MHAQSLRSGYGVGTPTPLNSFQKTFDTSLAENQITDLLGDKVEKERIKTEKVN
jgi:hypothetical protein